MRQGGVIGAVAAGVVGVLLLAWIGGEIHYRNCITEAELRNPVAARWKPGYSGGGIGGYKLGESPPEPRPSEPAHYAFYGQRDRSEALDQCSRWPL